MLHPYGVEPDSEYLTATKRLVDTVIGPESASVDHDARFPVASMAALGNEGFFGLCVDAAHGGRGQSPRMFAAVTEELAMACPSTAMVYVMHVTAAQAIASSDVLASRDDVLREIASGRHLTTLAFSEKGSRSQFWAPVSRLEENGDGYETSAAKSWVTSATHADSYVSSAQKPGAASPLESTVYLMQRTAGGVRITSGFDGLGLRGNDSSPVSLERLHVKKSDLISKSGEGANTMLQVVLPWFSIGTAAMANGISCSAMIRTAEHLSGTGFEHDGTKLRDLPVLRGGAAFSKQLGIERLFRDARAGWVMAPTADHLREFIGRVLTGLPLF